MILDKRHWFLVKELKLRNKHIIAKINYSTCKTCVTSRYSSVSRSVGFPKRRLLPGIGSLRVFTLTSTHSRIFLKISFFNTSLVLSEKLIVNNTRKKHTTLLPRNSEINSHRMNSTETCSRPSLANWLTDFHQFSTEDRCIEHQDN